MRTIHGKSTLRNISACSGGSHTTRRGRFINPHKTRLFGGGDIPRGSGALVGAGLVDMAIGGDQGGSIGCLRRSAGSTDEGPTVLVALSGIIAQSRIRSTMPDRLNPDRDG